MKKKNERSQEFQKLLLSMIDNKEFKTLISQDLKSNKKIDRIEIVLNTRIDNIRDFPHVGSDEDTKIIAAIHGPAAGNAAHHGAGVSFWIKGYTKSNNNPRQADYTMALFADYKKQQFVSSTPSETSRRKWIWYSILELYPNIITNNDVTKLWDSFFDTLIDYLPKIPYKDIAKLPDQVIYSMTVTGEINRYTAEEIKWLYDQTKNELFLPKEARDIFIF